MKTSLKEAALNPTPFNNPAYLKIDLFCRGMKIDESCALDSDARPIRRTRAGLGSGLEIVIPPKFYTNVPIEEKFVEGTPYSLHRENGRYFVRRDGRVCSEVTIPPRPAFYDRLTKSGKEMSRIGVMQGTYLAIYPGRICHFWNSEPRRNCKFCSTGLNIGTIEAADKTIEDVLETVRAAREECGITYVHFNTGYLEGEELPFLEPFVRAVKKQTRLMIGVQTTPAPDFKAYDRLAKHGVNNVSFCFEMWDTDILAKACPGKQETLGRDLYLDAIKYCKGKFQAVNGEIIAGLEPVDGAIEARLYESTGVACTATLSGLPPHAAVTECTIVGDPVGEHRADASGAVSLSFGAFQVMTLRFARPQESER